MRISAPLLLCISLRRNLSLTFFTKDTCLLCYNANKVLKGVLEAEDLRNIPLRKVDIMNPQNAAVFDMYCYDVPVLHVERPGQKKPVKFMHYFDAENISNELRREN